MPAENSLREQLELAYDEDQAPETPETPEKQVETPETPEKSPVEPEKTPEDPTKDEKSLRESTKDAKTFPKQAKNEKLPEKQEADAALPRSKAPGSWKPSAREKWNSLPAEIQQEVIRREREIAKGFNESETSRKFHEGFANMLQPYQSIIATEGNNPMQLINNLLSTAQTLYHGSVQQKVNTVAALIHNFGIDLQQLDTVLAQGLQDGGYKQQLQQRQQQDPVTMVRSLIQQELSPLFQQRQQMSQAEVQNEIDAFASDPKNEFFDDVKDTMADLLDVAAKQGKTMDLQTAYNRAILMHEEIAGIVTDRNLRSKAAEASAAAQAARKKAVSVTGAPAREIADGEQPSLRGDIMDAINRLS